MIYEKEQCEKYPYQRGSAACAGGGDPGEIKDPRISPWTSVVSVEVAPDLKSCKVWISVLGNEEVQASTLAGLKSAEGFIRSRLAKVVNLRNTPEITFLMDQSIAYGVNMAKKIDEVIARDDESGQEPGGSGGNIR